MGVISEITCNIRCHTMCDWEEPLLGAEDQVEVDCVDQAVRRRCPVRWACPVVLRLKEGDHYQDEYTKKIRKEKERYGRSFEYEGGEPAYTIIGVLSSLPCQLSRLAG